MARISVAEGIGYGSSGLLLDVYRPDAASAAPVAVLWHGTGPRERDVLAPLAAAAAGLGLVVFVPDWCSDADDGGRRQLRESVEFATAEAERFGGARAGFVLGGWSLGAKLAVGAALNPDALDGRRPRAAVGIAGAYGTVSALTGTAPVDDARRGGGRPATPVALLHGTRDTLVDVAQSRDLHAALTGCGHPVSLAEPDTDHAGAIMTAYSAAHGRCRPTGEAHAVRAGRTAAGLLAAAAGVPGTR